VQDGGRDRRTVKMQVRQNAGDCEGMVDVVLAAFAALALMRLRADLVCLFYDIYLGIAKILFQR